MRSNLARALIWSALSIALLDTALAAAMWIRIDPVVVQGSVLPTGSHETTAALSGFGIAVWAALVAAWAWALVRGLGLGRSLRSTAWLSFIGAQTLAITLLHPYLLLTLLRGVARERVIGLVERNLPALSQIYFHWGLQREWPWVYGLQVAATLLIAFTTLRVGERTGSPRE